MRFARLSAVLAIVGMLAAGCGKDEIDPSSIDEVYGGLSTADEEPLFGEEPLFAALSAAEADPLYADPIANDPAYLSAEQQVPALHYLLVVFGKLKRDTLDGTRDLTNPQDFSGSLSLSAGAMAVVRTVRFERRFGDGVVPRTDPRLVEWKATIFGGVDGLLVKFAAPSDATVTLSAAGQTVTRTVAELDLDRGIIDIPDSDDALAWAGAKVERAGGCAHGLLVGRWSRIAARGGLFRGRWVAADGELRGHMRGLFGERSDGDHVFFGKWIAAGGEFRGLLAGRYGEGVLKGHWLDRSLELRGRLKGIYFEPPVADDRSLGFYLGTWQEACAGEPIEPAEAEVR